MFPSPWEKTNRVLPRLGSILLIAVFLFSSLNTYIPGFCNNIDLPALPYLPSVGSLVKSSQHFKPVNLRGIELNPHDPFRFNFILDQAENSLSDHALRVEADRLLKYFFTALTIPSKDFWVNLSPYEHDSIIPDPLGKTDMGKDLLGEDYILKQLAASLTSPKESLGKKFWNSLHDQEKNLGLKPDTLINTFNKVWIVPDKCHVVEDGNCAFIKESRLKVMLEEDYIAGKHAASRNTAKESSDPIHRLSAGMMRKIILPVIEEEVNNGKNFLYLRQIYNSLILATWFKHKLRDGILDYAYNDQNKISEIKNNDPQIKEKIYTQYVESYKRGVYDLTQKELAPSHGGLPAKILHRKYFSGGFSGKSLPKDIEGQLSVQPNSYAKNITSLDNPVMLEVGAKPSFRPSARAPYRTSALLGLLMLVGCATSTVDKPVLVQRTAATEIRKDMSIDPGMYTLGEFDNNRPTAIFVHGGGGSPYDFEKFINKYQNNYNIVVFTYDAIDPIKDNASLLIKSYKNLIHTKHPKEVIFINHSFGNNVFAMAVKNDPDKLFAQDLVVQLAPTLAGSRLALGGSGIFAQAATSLISIFPKVRNFSYISEAQDPEGETVKELLSTPLNVKKVLRLAMRHDPHAPDVDSPEIFRKNYQKYIIAGAVVLTPRGKEDPHMEPLRNRYVIEAIDEAIRSFADDTKNLKTVFQSSIQNNMSADETDAPALIGKRGKAKNITINPGHQSGTADIYAADTENKLGQIQIRTTTNPLEQARKKIEQMQAQGNIQNKKAAEIILDMFNHIKNRGNPDFFTFDQLFADVFGFALSQQENKAIALHQALADNPIAISHEAGEYSVQQKLLKFSLVDNMLQVTLAGATTSFTLENETLAIARKGIRPNDTYDQHYGLRALQRICFNQDDKDLTETIQNMQLSTQPLRGGIDINLEKNLEVKNSAQPLSVTDRPANFSLDPSVVTGIRPLIINIYRQNKIRARLESNQRPSA